MDKSEAIAMIDKHKNALIDPTEMLAWTWLRVSINEIDDPDWYRAVGNTETILSK